MGYSMCCDVTYNVGDANDYQNHGIHQTRDNEEGGPVEERKENVKEFKDF